MPRADYKTVPLPFLCRGLQLAKPVDQLAPGEYAKLINVRSYQLGTLQTRNGTDNLGGVLAGQSPLHSIRRLNDPINNTYTHLYGAGTHLAYGQSAPGSDLGGGWSGNPLALVPWRPSQSPLAWMYVADSAQMAKVNAEGTQHSFGVPFVSAAPKIRIADSGVYPSLATSSSFFVFAESESLTDWSAGGTAGSLSLLSSGPGYRNNTTISYIAYDNGTGSGVCSIVPASIANIGQDSLVYFTANSEYQRVFEVLPAIPSTTIASILYDSGTTGACSIALTASPQQITKNYVLQIGTGGTEENVVVSDVVVSNQGQYSVRCTTVHNHVASEAVVGLASFRCATSNVYAATDTIQTDGIRSVISTGTGGFVLSVSESLGTFATFGNFQPDDYIHVSIRMGALANMIEGKVMFDVDASENNFTQNYYYYPFRPNDLIQSAVGNQTYVQAKTTAITNTQVDQSATNQQASVLEPLTAPPVYPPYRTGPTQYTALGGQGGDVGGSDVTYGAPNQTQLGQNQFLELSFRFSDLIRVGTDQSRNLNNVEAVQIQFNMSANTTVDIDSMWCGGFFGPDVGTLGQPYQYMIQYRVSSTGATSPFTPPARSGVVPRRQPVLVTFAESPTAEVDKADVYRFGGTLLQWTYVGTAQNSAGSFIDIQSDTALDADSLGNPDWYQPWPVEDQPKLGTTGTVAGSSIADSATNFNTSWAPGVQILINGYAATIYRVISTSLLETYENLGSQSAVTWEIPDPILMAQPMPCLWGPFENFFFACGDPKNPGRLYFSRGNDPDSTQLEYWIDVTTPSEPLMNGYVYNGTCFVRSSERNFRIFPTFGQFNLIDPTIPGPGLFRAIEVPNGKGLFMRWGYAIGPSVWAIGKDGIYEDQGGAATNITNDDLYPLFPHEGSVGEAINGYNPPNLVLAQATNHRLAYYDSCLYYDYIDTTGAYNTLMRKMAAPTDKQGVPSGWWYDQTTPTTQMHYGEEGQNVHNLLLGNTDGSLSQYDIAQGQDGANAISCDFRTVSTDLGDTRLNKFFGDLAIDCNTNNVTATVDCSFDNFSYGLVTGTIETPSRPSNPVVFDLGGEVEARNIAIDVSWSQTNANSDAIFYSWTPTAIPKPENIELRASDWDDAGYQGNKFIQGVVLEANTYGVTKTVNVIGDAGTIEATLSVTHDGQEQLPYSWPPFLTHMLRLQSTDDNPWELFGVRWVFNPAPEFVTFWETQTRPINGKGYGHMRDGYATIISNAPVTYQVIVDGVSYTVYDGDTGASTIPSTAGVQLKKYVIYPPIKGKIVRHNLTSSAPFALFMDSSEIRVHSWGDTGVYEQLRPFGDLSNTTGARI